MKVFFKHKKVGRRLVSLVILMGIYGYLVYQKDFPDVINTLPIESITAREILWRFQINEGKKFINQVVSVKGNVTSVWDSTIILNNSIYCMMDTLVPKEWLNFDSLQIKGRCLGYYKPLEQVQLDHCIVIKL